MSHIPDSPEAHLRRELVDAARRMDAVGLNRGTSGNLSARVGDGLLITPSGQPTAGMSPDDVVRLDLGAPPDPAVRPRPSSEWRLHQSLLRARPELGAVVHAHAAFSTALACHRRSIPAFHYMVAVAGGDDIRCASYATFGTAELARAAVDAMAGRRACLLAHHGLLAAGEDLAGALALALEVEALAEQYWRALQLGEPPLLPGDEMARVRERFSAYRRGDLS